MALYSGGLWCWMWSLIFPRLLNDFWFGLMCLQTPDILCSWPLFSLSSRILVILLKALFILVACNVIYHSSLPLWGSLGFESLPAERGVKEAATSWDFRLWLHILTAQPHKGVPLFWVVSGGSCWVGRFVLVLDWDFYHPCVLINSWTCRTCQLLYAELSHQSFQEHRCLGSAANHPFLFTHDPKGVG